MPFNKLFSLGLTKTGTTSIHHALLTLGIASTHDLDHARAIDKAVKTKQPPLSLIPKKIQAITGGTVWHQHLAVLDQSYPGSKFILPIRDVDDWLVSIKRHTIRHNQLNHGKKPKRSFDPIKLRQTYNQHIKRIKEYFKDRPQDLLIINIIGGEGYEKLCPFLGIPTKNGSFPHKNSLKKIVKVTKI